MNNYEKPEVIEIEDVIAASLDQNGTDNGVKESIKDFFGEV